MTAPRQQNAGSADEATQGGEAARDFSWAEISVWTKRMLSAVAKRRQRRQMVRVDGQGVCARNAGDGLDQGPGQQGRGGRGWAEHRAVRGSGGYTSGRVVGGFAGGLLPTTSCQA